MQVVPASLVERGLPSAEFSCRGHELPPAVIWPPQPPMFLLLPSTPPRWGWLPAAAVATISNRKAWEFMLKKTASTVLGGRPASPETWRGGVDQSPCQISSNKPLLILLKLIRRRPYPLLSLAEESPAAVGLQPCSLTMRSLTWP